MKHLGRTHRFADPTARSYPVALPKSPTFASVAWTNG